MPTLKEAMETPKIEASPKENMQEKVYQRLEAASKNPISESRLVDLESQLNVLTDKFIKTGSRDVDDIAAENKIEEEILRSSALADNIIEFKETLKQLTLRYGKGFDWTKNFLAHENSHANVSEATDHEWVGYGTIFIKDEQGSLTGIQPLHFSRSPLAWGPKEMILKRIELTEAPEKYGDILSPGDETLLEADRKRLEEIKKKEEKDEEYYKELKKEFNIK